MSRGMPITMRQRLGIIGRAVRPLVWTVLPQTVYARVAGTPATRVAGITSAGAAEPALP